MKIQLDSSALTALVASSGTDFTLELQRAVVAEVGRKTFLRDLGEILKLVEPALVMELVNASKTDKVISKAFEEALQKAVAVYSNQYPSGWKLTGAQKKLIETEVDAQISAHRARIVASATDRVDDAVKAYIDRFDERLPALLNAKVNQHLQLRIDQGVADRLAALKAAI